MRVAILAIYIRGADGVGLQLNYWIGMLQEQGHSVTLYVESIGSDVPADVRAIAIEADGLRFHRSSYWNDVQAADLVICDYPAYFGLAEAIRLLTKPAILMLYHGVTPPDQWLDNDGRQYLEMSRRRSGLVHFAHYAVTRSEWMREELHHLTGYPRERIGLMPCIVEPTHSLISEPASPPYMLYVGRIAAHKRPEMLVEALAVVRQSIPDAQLVLAGDVRGPSHAPVVDKLRRRADALGIADAVLCTGSVAPVVLEQLYRRAMVFVCASAHEGFCTPVVEAMAYGIPVVVTATTALPETVGDAGIAVADDIPALADAIVRVMRDHTLHDDLAQRGLGRARIFRREALSGHFKDIVEHVVAQPHHTQARPRLRQLVDLARLHVGAEVAPPPPPARTNIISRAAAALRRWFQSDVHRQLDDLMQRQVTYNRQVAHTLDTLDEWSAEVSEQQAAADMLHAPHTP